MGAYSQIFAVENFHVVIFDSYGTQTHTEVRSILVSKTYKINLLDRNIIEYLN